MDAVHQEDRSPGAEPGMGGALFDPSLKGQMPHIYAMMREREPVSRVPTPDGRSLWIVSRYDDGLAVLRDYQRFGNDPGRIYSQEQLEQVYAPLIEHLSEEQIARVRQVDEAVSRHLLGVDPPDHSRLRKLVSQSFTPRYVEGLRPRVQAIADELLDGLAARSRAGEAVLDLVDGFAFPLPLTVIAEMLGVPVDMREKFKVWSTAAVGFDPTHPGDPALNDVLFEFVEYIRWMIAEKRVRPADDLLSGLVIAEEEGDRLTEPELVAMAFLLIVAGHETTVNLIGNAMVLLSDHPDQRAMLAADPGLARNAVEEVLRHTGPVEHSISRWVREPAEIAGQAVGVGDQVIVVLASGNRDPRQFPDPDRFDITREPGRHLAFGMGIHACLGAPLARIEGQIALNSLLARFPDVRLAAPSSELVWRPGSLIHGYVALPVALGPSAA
ncbi:MAG: cytochrome P450 [Chloroflexota bacterium]